MAEGLPSARILCLDDSEAELEAMALPLREAGHTVLGARTVEQARPYMRNIDLVIVDFHMPELNGAEAMHLLKESASREKAPLFYLYTADKDVAISFKAHGFDGAFSSKGQGDVLVSQVETALRRLNLKRFMAQRTPPVDPAPKK
jgi:two-component system phosphate regulon response regulator PhoB